MDTDRIKNTIFFTIEYKGQIYPVSTFRNQYYSLMTLIADHLSPTDFGICSGMGSCGTCMITIKRKHSSLEQQALACEVLVNDELSGYIIVVR